jgi:leukotriene-A4 hydrolase
MVVIMGVDNDAFCWSTHRYADLAVDMVNRCIHGYVILHLKSQRDGTDKLILDTRGLDIKAVHDLGEEPDTYLAFSASSAPELGWELGTGEKVFGAPLSIHLSNAQKQGSQCSVGIHFFVPSSSSALQILEAEQTAGGTHPFLFSQCQAIHARSLVPCQARFCSGKLFRLGLQTISVV